MIVCMCRGVSDRDLTEAIRRGARTLDDLSRRCNGAGTDCGGCRCFIEANLLRDARVVRS
jgi:bacterioferritin-associated ferredoxin